jgi:methionyl aminopeptidase
MNARAQLLSRRFLAARAAAAGSGVGSSSSSCGRALPSTWSASSPLPSPSHHPRLAQTPSPHQRPIARLQHLAPVSGGRRGLSELLNLRGGGGGDMKKKSNATSSSPARPPLRPHPISARLPVPDSVPKPPYVDALGEIPYEDGYQVQETEKDKELMRESGLFAARVLDAAGALVRPGVSTDEIDKFVHQMCVANNAYPSPLTYGGFPKSVCTSVNECICHGIPDARILQEGDILNIDVTIFKNGHHGDTSRMFFVGQVSDEAKRLCEVTTRALDAAISICRPGVPFNKIGETIHAIADSERLGVVKEFVGHGVGKVFHSNPVILHCRNREPGVMKEGMTFTIEPMLCLG